MTSGKAGDQPARKRKRTPSRRMLIKRIERLLEQQIEKLEQGTVEQSPEKEVALLGNLARTLEKLMDLDEKQKPMKPASKQGKEIEQIRKQLADRMNALGVR